MQIDVCANKLLKNFNVPQFIFLQHLHALVVASHSDSWSCWNSCSRACPEPWSLCIPAPPRFQHRVLLSEVSADLVRSRRDHRFGIPLRNFRCFNDCYSHSSPNFLTFSIMALSLQSRIPHLIGPPVLFFSSSVLQISFSITSKPSPIPSLIPVPCPAR